MLDRFRSVHDALLKGIVQFHLQGDLNIVNPSRKEISETVHLYIFVRLCPWYDQRTSHTCVSASSDAGTAGMSMNLYTISQTLRCTGSHGTASYENSVPLAYTACFCTILEGSATSS